VLNNFFKLNEPFQYVNSSATFFELLAASDLVQDVAYTPRVLTATRPYGEIKGKTFKNVSFKATTVRRLEFRACTFRDCLFLGTMFRDCEFHDCRFVGCNPYKARFSGTYINPLSFDENTLLPSTQSNIGVGLYQQLLANALQAHQSDFAGAAEFLFRRWKRHLLGYEHKRKKTLWASFALQWTRSKVYEVFAGYGLRPGRFALWSLAFLVAVISLNHLLWGSLSMTGNHQGLERRQPIVSAYYTIVTLTTVGYGDIVPGSLFGMAVACVEALVGIVWLSMLVGVVFRKVFR
jgi:hypothetical protein